MAQITINEISQNYTFNIGSSSFATVALPITASWGPGFVDPDTLGKTKDEVLEETTWQRFPATQAGLESFISTYRGPAANYRSAKDYSFQMAQTLLTSGYDILVCRLCPGTYAYGSFNKPTYSLLSIKPSDWDTDASKYYKKATKLTYSLLTSKPSDWDTNYSNYYIKSSGDFVQVPAAKPEYTDNTYYECKETETEDYTKVTNGTSFKTGSFYTSSVSDNLIVKAKYPGTFGNSIMSTIRFIPTTSDSSKGYWNLVVYVIDASGIKTAVENLVFVFDMDNSSDSILHISEVESNFLTFEVAGSLKDDSTTSFDKDQNASVSSVTLAGGKDRGEGNDLTAIRKLAYTRYGLEASDPECKYITALSAAASVEGSDLDTIYYNEWLYTHAVDVYALLKDKLTYSPNRIVSPGWDDQDIVALGGTLEDGRLDTLSPLHLAIMDAAYHSRCATGLLDIPKSLPRSGVYNDSLNEQQQGYAQMLARYIPDNSNLDVNGSLYQTHSALFAPWGQYTYVGTSRQNTASPSFMALLIQRAMMSNQSVQYEWALPTNRKHSVKIGKLNYTVPKKVLDDWQSLEGVGVNAITTLPDLGTCLWGNSTLYEVPPATYQALANLSTRYLVNAVEDVVYRAGISITFQYNNNQAYNKFYAAVTPILDTMKNVGAITGYKVKMAADIDGLDSVNANTIVGKIYLAINGVVNDIIVDLVALPPNVDLNSFE